MFTYAKSVAEANSIDINDPVQPHRQRKIPRHFDDGIVYQSIGARDTLPTSQNYKVVLYFPVLDSLLLELRDRFSHKNIKLMKAISSINPQSNTFLDASTLKPLAIGYNLDYDCLSMEATLAKKTLANYELENVRDVFLELLPLKSAFPTLIKAVQISMTMVVGTAHCERSFSALKRIKTYLRASMGEERLKNLSILAIEKKLASELSLDDVVDCFVSKDKNTRIVLK